MTIYRIASHLTLGVFLGTTTTQGTFATSWEQAYATACPWLPLLWVTIPFKFGESLVEGAIKVQSDTTLHTDLDFAYAYFLSSTCPHKKKWKKS